MPLILIAIMTFVLITSSGTMAMAVNFPATAAAAGMRDADAGHGDSPAPVRRHAGVRMDEADPRGRAALGQPDGAAQFGSTFFMITGFHGFHVGCGVIYLLAIANKVRRGDYDAGRRGTHPLPLSWRSPGCTGTSWTWSGSSSSRCSISGEAGHCIDSNRPPTRPSAPESRRRSRGPAPPDRPVLKVWILLFVLSTMSYMVDYFPCRASCAGR